VDDEIFYTTVVVWAIVIMLLLVFFFFVTVAILVWLSEFCSCTCRILVWVVAILVLLGFLGSIAQLPCCSNHCDFSALSIFLCGYYVRRKLYCSPY
jgi:hypothetical protein